MSEIRQFPTSREYWMNKDAEEDVHGPLPCGCYRIEVWDFGHKRSCGTEAER